MDRTVVKAHLDAHARHLRDSADAIGILLKTAWANRFPTKAGVYAVFDAKKLIYVGETGSLRGRMKDLRDTRNHTLRRQIGAAKFNDRNGYQPATSKRKFPETIEKLLNEYIEKNLSVKLLPVLLGRKEIEERLIEDESPRFNVKTRRGDAE
ncbi:MAG: hypothetical protein HY651_01280 [Acidobacteria bacterium]|nr:hypothetical protein [Acidobacteriota bacterium]